MLDKIKYRKRHIWTPEEDKIIRDCYPDTDTLELAGRFGVTVEQLYRRTSFLRVAKSEAYNAMKKAKEAEVLREAGKRYRFVKGNIPANKGKKMSADVYARASPTMFKKGCSPPNTKYDGCVSVRTDSKSQLPYKYIRIAKGKWELYHRVVWEQTHGPIPAGHMVRFIDGDTLNTDIGNLEIVSRGQHAVDNMYKLNKLPEELQETFRLRVQLNKLINNKKKKRK